MVAGGPAAARDRADTGGYVLLSRPIIPAKFTLFPPKSPSFTVLLGALAALPVLSIDISAPTLVLLPDALETTPFMGGLTLSLFMAGFALGQFGAGVLSDGHGRRPVLLAGLLAFTTAGGACALAWSGPGLVISRFIQGIGAGACSVLAFAMVQDLFEGEAARRRRVVMTMIFGILPIFAPALGSVISEFVGWRTVYILLACCGGTLLAAAWAGVAESRPAAVVRADRSCPSQPLHADRHFVGLALSNALSYGAIFAYVAGSPVVVMGDLGFSALVFAAVFAGTAIAITAGAWSSSRLIRLGVALRTMMTASFLAMAGSTAVLACISLGSTAWLEVTAVPLVFCMIFARGIVAPNLQHLAIERQRTRAGSASAALGVSQLLFAACAAAVVAALLPRFGAAAVAVPMAILTSCSLAVWLWLHRRGKAGPGGQQHP